MTMEYEKFDYSPRASSLSPTSSSLSSLTTPQFHRHSRYLIVEGNSLFLFFVTISAPLLKTRSEAAEVAGIARKS